MANFCSYPAGARISSVSLPNALDADGGSVTIGLWGYLDFDGKELQILAPPMISIRRGEIKGNIRLYEVSGYHPGRWSVEAITARGATWDKLDVIVQPRKGSADMGGHKYTESPNEAATKRTTPTAGDVVSMLLTAWPELTGQGARTLTAQFMHETGDGLHCYNWNLGNVKASAAEPHMYLQGVWEVGSPAAMQAQVDSAKGLAHLATADEIKKHGWSCPPGQAVAVFDPPHAQSRFHAYDSLVNGAQRWMGHHRAIAGKNPTYLASVNGGDCTAVAHILKIVGYYTGGETDYANGMTGKKRAIDAALGPL
jgi:hypothetical protein